MRLEAPFLDGLNPGDLVFAVLMPKHNEQHAAHPFNVEVSSRLRDFMLNREVLDAGAFDSVLTGFEGDNAASFIDYLAECGHLTATQAPMLIKKFEQLQNEHARNFVQYVVSLGMVTEQMAEQTLHDYKQDCLFRSIELHLIESGVLTEQQVERIERKLATPSGEVRSQPPQGTGGSVAGILKRRGVVLALGATAVVLGLFFGWSQVFPKRFTLEPSCTMNGMGEGECVFTNTEKGIGSACGVIAVSCSDEVRISGKFCSGDVENNQTRKISFSVAEMDKIRPRRGDWRDSCKFVFVAEDSK